MRIVSVRHRGLRRFIEHDDAKELRADLVPRIRRVLTALILARNVQNILGPPGWHIHQLTGERMGTWSISVSGNWRVTFTAESNVIEHLDLEDYH